MNPNNKKYYLAIIALLTLSAIILFCGGCTITIKPIVKVQEKTFGQAQDKKLLQELFNHCRCQDVNSMNGQTIFKLHCDDSARTIRRFVFQPK